jgi:hypothetical protein
MSAPVIIHYVQLHGLNTNTPLIRADWRSNIPTLITGQSYILHALLVDIHPNRTLTLSGFPRVVLVHAFSYSKVKYAVKPSKFIPPPDIVMESFASSPTLVSSPTTNECPPPMIGDRGAVTDNQLPSRGTFTLLSLSLGPQLKCSPVPQMRPSVDLQTKRMI